MNYSFPLRRRRLARVVVLAVVVALAPLPVMAGPPGTPARPTPTPIQKSVAAIVASEPLQASPAAAAQAAPEELSSPSFFSRPVGLAVLAVVAAGAGYAIYSSRHDRIHSVVREGQ